VPEPVFIPQGAWAGNLDAVAGADLNWLWTGYLAPHLLTLLTSQWKLGKTTLLSLLLARRVAGGEFAGRPLTAGRTAVVSEEDYSHWRERGRKLDFGDRTWFLCRPFRSKPTHQQWAALIDHLAERHARDGIDLVVIDPLAAFLPGRDENNATLMLEALVPLYRLAALEVAILLLHHPRKGQTAEGQAARGSGALTGFADVLIEMRPYCPDDPDDRRRVLHTFSRFTRAPRRLVIELTADGTDYVAHGDLIDSQFRASWDRLRLVLEGARAKLTLREVLAGWPEGDARPSETTLWRWLSKGVEHGLVRRDGLGRFDSPHRYWLAGIEERWRTDPLSQLWQAMQADLPPPPVPGPTDPPRRRGRRGR
jgi:hypothetical protein